MNDGGFKRVTYIFLFTAFGAMVGVLVHAIFEILYINLLIKNFAFFSLGLSWGTIYFVHAGLTLVLLFGGAWLGYKQGVYWWQKIYVERNLGRFLHRLKNKLR